MIDALGESRRSNRNSFFWTTASPFALFSFPDVHEDNVLLDCVKNFSLHSASPLDSSGTIPSDENPLDKHVAHFQRLQLLHQLNGASPTSQESSGAALWMR